MNDPGVPRRSRLVTAFAAAAGLLAAAAVAVPAAGATAGRGQDGAASARVAAPTASRTKTKKTKKITGKTTTTLRTTTRTTSSRPHCTGCVEHAVFGFEDGTTERWLPYGKASAEVNKGVMGSLTSLGPVSGSAMPRTGQRQLTVSGMGNAAGLRWPGTSDTILAGFQARVWVRSRARTGTLTLRISNSYASVSASAVVGPQGWTAITTPFFFGNHQTATISLTQENYCADGDLGMIDLDDTAIASSFTNDPPVWRADDTSLLNAALPQITLSMVPCPSTTSPTPTSEPTVLDFEDGTTQGWVGINGATVRVDAASALSGALGLRVGGLAKSEAAARLTTQRSAWRGSGTWFHLTMRASGKGTSTGSPTIIRRTCGPTTTIYPTGPLWLRVTMFGSTAAVSNRVAVTPQGTDVSAWFLMPEGNDPVTVDVAVSGHPRGPLSIDDVTLSMTTPPTSTASDDLLGTASPAAGVQPLC